MSLQQVLHSLAYQRQVRQGHQAWVDNALILADYMSKEQKVSWSHHVCSAHLAVHNENTHVDHTSGRREKRAEKQHSKGFCLFLCAKKHLLDLDQKQAKSTDKSDRVEQNYYNDFPRKSISGVALYNSVNMLYLYTLWPWSAVHIHLCLVGFLRLVMQGQCHYGNKQGQKSCTLRHNNSPSSPPPCVCQAQTSQSE